MKKMLLFGAGKIGRSFIAQIFSRSGYEVVFVDTDDKIVSLLNKHNKYPVVFRAETDTLYVVEPVRAINFSERHRITEEMAEADIIGTSVGVKALDQVLVLMAEGLQERVARAPHRPVNVILAENMRNASAHAKEILKRRKGHVPLPEGYVGWVETSIGKMVPLMEPADLEKDPLLVLAEPYNILLADRDAFVGEIPAVDGLETHTGFRAWVDRKLFIHNLGHAAVAYLGNYLYPRMKYTWEVLEKEDFRERIRLCMKESATVLMALYPRVFSETALDDHILDLIRRFANRALKDTIFRVGSDLGRKLGPDDRVVYPLKQAFLQELPYERILMVLVSALFFRATDTGGNRLASDEELFSGMGNHVERWLTELCGLQEGLYLPLRRKAEKMYRDLSEGVGGRIGNGLIFC